MPIKRDRSVDFLSGRRTDGLIYRPQTLPLLHEVALGFPQYEVARPPGAWAANSEIFFLT
jgi:hypothetical protein